MRVARIAALALLGLEALPGSASARSTATVSYPAQEIWPTTVRFLRVDRSFPVKEKDESAGYILFEYIDRDQRSPASLELVKTTDGQGREATSLVLTMSDLPRHVEMMLLDKLHAKIKQERGAPAAPPPKKQPPAEDKDKDKARGNDRSDDKAKDKAKGNDDKGEGKDVPPSLEYYREK